MSITYTANEFDEIDVYGEFPISKIAALRESIRKWKWLVKYLGKHSDEQPLKTGVASCALCDIFLDDGCVECPVYQRTKMKYCKRTPYDKYVTAAEKGNYIKAYKYAKEEVEFLESLLPKKSPK